MKKINNTESDLYKHIIDIINDILDNPYDILDKYLNKDIFIVQYDKDEIIFEIGDDGNNFFIICEGKVGIYKDKEEIAILEKKDFFGEMSMVFSSYRNATAIALSDCICLQIPKNIFDILMDTNAEFKKIVQSYAKARKILNE